VNARRAEVSNGGGQVQSSFADSRLSALPSICGLSRFFFFFSSADPGLCVRQMDELQRGSPFFPFPFISGGIPYRILRSALPPETGDCRASAAFFSFSYF